MYLVPSLLVFGTLVSMCHIDERFIELSFFFFFLAAVDLICIENISVVIGTQNILQAEFITYLANKTKVPVISFSATRDAVTQ